MIAERKSFEPHSSEQLPNSDRAYIHGTIHPDLRVPFREIKLSPTKSYTGRVEVNEPVRVYDTSGPWGDESFQGEVEQGLPPLRREWIIARGDVEEVAPRNKTTGNGHGAPRTSHFPPRTSLRAKPGRTVSQLHYARKGIITPEMEFIAIRENLGRQSHASTLQRSNAPRHLGGESFGAAIPNEITPEFV